MSGRLNKELFSLNRVVSVMPGKIFFKQIQICFMLYNVIIVEQDLVSDYLHVGERSYSLQLCVAASINCVCVSMLNFG